MNSMAQGDILLVNDGAKPPSEARLRKSGIVAEGEATGHHHVAMGDVAFYENPEVDLHIAGWIVAGPLGGALVHEEHGSVEIAPGTMWTVRRQAEVDPFTGIPRRVSD